MINQQHDQYCDNRLPCGICKLTNSQCPKMFFSNFDFSKVTCTNAPSSVCTDSVTYATTEVSK